MLIKQKIFIALISLSLLTVAQYISSLSQNKNLNVYFLDVGQGDSIFVAYPTGEKLLIDTGKDSKVFRSLDAVLPWYNRKIDYLLLTHGDLDHIGSASEILDRYFVKKIFVSEYFGVLDIEKEIQQKAKSKSIPIEVLQSGDMFTFGTEVQNTFKILHPNTGCLEIYKNENDCSLVGLLTYGSSTFLFTGDIAQELENKVALQIQDPVTVLKVSHHGSKFSSGSEFLSKIKPQYSVIQSGPNSYGHPAPEVLERLLVASTTIFNTKEDATIVASSDGESLEIKKLFDQASFFQSSICAILLYGFDSSC